MNKILLDKSKNDQKDVWKKSVLLLIKRWTLRQLENILQTRVGSENIFLVPLQ